MSNLKTIEVKYSYDVPKNFTGIAKFPNGTKFWYKDGELYREDGPAVESPIGSKGWYKDGKLHREDGPAIEYANGSKAWLKDGQFHREDGPAATWADGTKIWYKDGKRHREDGPAIEYSDRTKKWYLNNILLTEQQYEIIMMFSEESRERLYKNNNKGLKNLFKR